MAMALLLTVAGCPKRTRQTLVPPQPPPSTIDLDDQVPSTGDMSARARFQQAQTQFALDSQRAESEFAAIAREFPLDPVAPYALLYAGVSALQRQSYDAAVAHLSGIATSATADAEVRGRGSLFLGIAEGYRRRHERALDYLRAGQPAIRNDGERAAWLAAMAEALRHSASPLEAVGYYDTWYPLASAVERAHIVRMLSDLAVVGSNIEVRRHYEALADKGGPAAAVLGWRVAEDWQAEGRADLAREVRNDISASRRALGLDRGAELGPDGTVGIDGADGTTGNGDMSVGTGAVSGAGQRLGALLPLSGRRARTGDLAMRGLSLAAGTFAADGNSGSGAPAGFDLTLRDSASGQNSAEDAVEALASEGVVAVVGPIDSQTAAKASGRAHGLRLPILLLDPRPERGQVDGVSGNSPYVFYMLQSAETRARALALHSVERGVRRFAVMRPSGGYGRVVGAAFAAEVAALGGTIVGEAIYQRNSTSFGDVIATLPGDFEALFIPDRGDQLALIAPALAAADLVAQPRSAKPRTRQPKVGRGFLLLSTAEFLAPSYVRGAARYSLGGILAPGFYPDALDPRIGDFVTRYERAYGKPPTPLDAYAYDAALLIADAITSGRGSRAAISAYLAEAEILGVTGTVAFDDSRRRRDRGLLYQVVQTEDGAYAIRAMRD